MALDDKQEADLKAAHEAAIKTQNDKIAELEAKIKAAPAPADKGKGDAKGGDAGGDKAGGNTEDETLADKARREREEKEKSGGDVKRIETALSFNMGAKNFVKEHADYLPQDAEAIVAAAEKESYDSAIEKSVAIKESLIQEFFKVQSNLELLTAGQKNQIAEFQKLTKNGRQGKAEFIFENVLEPALETLKKIKKAEQVAKARGGYASSSKAEDAYISKLVTSSRKAHLGEKETK